MKYNFNTYVKLLQEKYNEPFEIKEYNGTSKPGVYYCGYCQKEYSIYKMGKLLSPDRKHICTHCFSSQYATQVLELIKIYPELMFIKFGYKENLHKPTVIYKCNKCNEITEKPYTEFIKYPTCIHCGENAKRRNNNTLNFVLPEGFELVGDYKDQYTKVLFKHKCGFIFNIRPKDLISGHSFCPKCSKKASKGERAIMEYLNNNNINFTKEKVFEWSNLKRYDFYLPEYNLLIEYNGLQHYKEVPTFKIPLKEQQAIDKWKEEMAIKNNYKILIIPYTEYNNINNILAQRLKENA